MLLVQVEVATRQLPGRPSHLVLEVASKSPATSFSAAEPEDDDDLDLTADMPPASSFLLTSP
jgi:hypothetical protein